jgi:hypothetical protein
MASKLFVNSIDGLTTETDFDIYFAPKNGMRANEINVGRPGKRLKKELNIVQDMLSVLVNRPIRTFDLDTVYQFGELVQTQDIAGDTEFIKFWQSQVDGNIAIHPEWDENNGHSYWKEFEPFGNYETEDQSGDYKNDVKFGYQMHNSGYFIVGERQGRNVSIDRDEITARTVDLDTNTVHPSLLRMQANGGMLTIHGNLWEVESERYRVSTFTDDGRFILGNKETINTDTDPHPYDNCYKFECWGDALITQDARFGGWVTFDKGFHKIPAITIQAGTDAALTDRLYTAPAPGSGEIEINALLPIVDEGSTLHIQNHVSQTGDVMINSLENIVHITKDGRIGVKKINPDYTIEAQGSIVSNDGTHGGFRIINNDSKCILNTCGDEEFYLNCYGVDDAPKDMHIQNAGADTYFNCINSPIHLTSEGRIGVGVVDPQCALDVLGNGFISSNLTVNSFTIANEWKTLTIDSGIDADAEYSICTGAHDGSETRLILQASNLSDTVFNGASASCVSAEAPVHITNTGAVGVGRLDPEYKVDVVGGARFTDKIVIENLSPSDVAIEVTGRVVADYFDGAFDLSKGSGAVPAATHADSADFATDSNHAITADNATNSDHANFADCAENAKAIDANCSDVAEKYEADEVYEPGTICSIGGDKEITLGQDDKALAGVISTAPAVFMNNNENTQTDKHLYVALTGRVPCKVNGDVKKGQYIVIDKDGKGKGVDMPFNPLLVVGVALSDSIDGIVEVKV